MAHKLSFNSKGEAEFFSLRQPAWHGLGTVVDRELADDEVLRTAGLDWRVNEFPVFAFSGSNVNEGPDKFHAAPGFKALVREDNNRVLSVVSERYRCFQNIEMIQLLRAISGETDLIWETAGALDNGRNVWALCRMPSLKLELGKDVSLFYMLVSNGHGNKRCLEILPTVVRVVCANTMRMAVGSVSDTLRRAKNVDKGDFSAPALADGYAIRHQRGLDTSVKDVVRAYQWCVENHSHTVDAFKWLAEKPCTRASAEEYWNNLFELEVPESQETRGDKMVATQAKNVQAKLGQIWISDTIQVDGTANTWFSAYQTAVEYIDHESRTRAGSSRFGKSNFGLGANLKERAWDMAFELAEATA